MRGRVVGKTEEKGMRKQLVRREGHPWQGCRKD